MIDSLLTERDVDREMIDMNRKMIDSLVTERDVDREMIERLVRDRDGHKKQLAEQNELIDHLETDMKHLASSSREEWYRITQGLEVMGQQLVDYNMTLAGRTCNTL